MTIPALTNQISADIPNMAKIITPIASSATIVTVTGTTETTLKSTTISAALMGGTGIIKAYACGQRTGLYGDKTIKLYWGTQSWPVIWANHAGHWMLEIYIQNSSATVQRIWWKAIDSYCQGFNPYQATTYSAYQLGSQDTASAVTLKLTAQSVSANDSIDVRSWLVQQEYYPG